jgi:anthranilate phosphoribosyltransferase
MAKITEYLEIILEGKDLTFEQAEALLDIVFEGEVAEVQIAAFLAAMRIKKAAVSEIAGLASFRCANTPCRSRSTYPAADRHLRHRRRGRLKTFNISTAAAWSPPAPAPMSPSTATAASPACAARPTS